MFTKNVRLGIPSKGRMAEQTLMFLQNCDLTILRNGRDYIGRIVEVPNIQVIFQRQEDIVKGVESGLLDLGIAGYDLVSEIPDRPEEITIVHEQLEYGKCTLEVAVPDTMKVSSISQLKGKYRVATKFSNLTAKFLMKNGIQYEFVKGAGTLEVSPALGNADIIVDLVSTGKTLADNRLSRIEGGQILESQATFIANTRALQNQEVFEVTSLILEYFEASLRARNYISLFVNVRGNPDEKLQLIKKDPILRGLQGPTVSNISSTDSEKWFAMHVVIPQSKLTEVIKAIRKFGGSGAVTSPVSYIFEEEPERIQQLKKIIRKEELQCN